MAVRQSIQGLSRNASRLALTRCAYERFQSVRDDRGYQWFSQLHGLPLAQWCEHGTELFLPWHRAYLYFFELGLQSRIGPRLTIVSPEIPELADVGIPWWDWASPESHVEGIPTEFATPAVNNSPNPFHSSEIASVQSNDLYSVGVWSRGLVNLVRQRAPGAINSRGAPRSVRDPGPPDDLPRQHTLDNIVLQQNTFETFSNSLEAVHDDVHAWAGGSMSLVPTAAFDPIFWSHHAMIDRLWAIWQNSALGEDPPASMLSTVLTPFPMTVADTLRLSRLGYSYAVQAST